MERKKMKLQKTVFLGDSITEGYGVKRDECWVSQQNGYICNRGISGDTTAGMCRRFQAHVLREAPERAVIMGGLNDLLLGYSVQSVCENLKKMYDAVLDAGIMLIPAICVRPDFDELLGEGWISSRKQLALLPENIAYQEDWIREYVKIHDLNCIDFARYFPEYTPDGYQRYFIDGVHLNARGHAIMAKIAAQVLEK